MGTNSEFKDIDHVQVDGIGHGGLKDLFLCCTVFYSVGYRFINFWGGDTEKIGYMQHLTVTLPLLPSVM